MRTRFLSIVILLTTVAINAQQKKVVHVDKKRSGQVDVNQLDGEFLRKEIIRQVKRFSDRP